MKALSWVVGVVGVLFGVAVITRVIRYWDSTEGETGSYVLLLGIGVGIAIVSVWMARGLAQRAQWAVATASVLGIMLGVVVLTWAAATLIS
ncbi:hypothetical protein [Demequina sediminicola]|uniref:hypothetical protein n=1 Tax=Demequina sediminicola TaxID=1095026 RepID=UPI00078532B0|nr:hypothetical protein [Demequina sediminicola]